jgi:hypothetical protein
MNTEPENNSSTPPSDPPSLVSQNPPPADTPPPSDTSPAKEGEPPKVEDAPQAPEPLTWEAIKLPEGITVDDEAKQSFLDIMNDDKATPAERAQKLVDLQTSLMQKGADATYQAWTDMQTQWQDEVRADPVIGGEKLAPVLGEVSKLIDKYGSPEVRQIMDLTGAGNNIHVIRMLHNMAKDLSEGGPVLGAPPSEKASLADRLYPSMKKQGA